MLDRFMPDKSVKRVTELDPQTLKSLGVEAVIYDVDDTLVSHRTAAPDEKLKEYLFSVRDAGIDVALVSNNGPERVETFDRDLGFFFTAKAKKPKKSALLPSLEHFKRDPAKVAFVGDQLLTDCLCAKRNGIRFFFVEPIDRYENPFFVVKRALEKPLLLIYRRRLRRKSQK